MYKRRAYTYTDTAIFGGHALHVVYTFFFYKQLHFPSQPGVAKEIWENEAESCLAVAYVLGCFLHEIKENGHF